ncbi:hypothetical protein OG735_37155 [Streptomyces sp. NBC_01210]|uniref:hypothetical protein n=1 Tax=Streptomyces sp. NBC_01210 TaxID=2903774 RepID=UPI002E0FC4AA|nr:hypothetical protein OG735_37155 [Streptomyces sp. NBC_01210]
MADQQHSLARTYAALRRWAPPPAPTGFLVLLVVMFALSYGVGSAVGPVAPGMHSTGTGSDGGSEPHGDGGMGDMHSGGER